MLLWNESAVSRVQAPVLQGLWLGSLWGAQDVMHEEWCSVRTPLQVMFRMLEHTRTKLELNWQSLIVSFRLLNWFVIVILDRRWTWTNIHATYHLFRLILDPTNLPTRFADWKNGSTVQATSQEQEGHAAWVGFTAESLHFMIISWFIICRYLPKRCKSRYFIVH